VLLDLFLVQPFTLLDVGFAGLAHVAVDLLLLGSLRYALHEEDSSPPGGEVPPEGRGRGAKLGPWLS
jgi:hypothetical protein